LVYRSGPDPSASVWITYSRRLRNYLSAVFVYSAADGKPTQITDGMSDARYAVFDKEGKYLYRGMHLTPVITHL